MPSQKITFKNKEDISLSGRLDLPADSRAKAIVLFAHCFTCNKNFNAVRNISQGLTNKGFGVFQFDFTGLGSSEGNFSDTDFSANVADLTAAAEWLKENHQAPSLLVGHSLGGAAVLRAAAQLKSVQAVATIGAPAEPEHVTHLFEGDIAQIKKEGKATVDLGGRKFTIKKQFIEDLTAHSVLEELKKMRKSVLFMHSPQDQTVDISNAAKLYESAHHPKSFVSLDGADHLISKKEDAIYTGHVIATWAERYLKIESKEKNIKTEHQVVAVLEKEDGFTTALKADKHFLTADEPKDVGGNEYGPSPYEFVASGLAACTAMTIKMYTDHKKWPLDRVEVHVSHKKEHANDGENTENDKAKIELFEREVKLEGNLNEEQRERILEIANKCPVHKTLENGLEIRTELWKG